MSLGQGVVWFQCPPRGDRAANGRVDRYALIDGKYVYAFFYCMYPTDEYAPIEREQGRGKIYTGGEASFYRTADSNGAKQDSTSGTRTDTTGYVSRNVNLANPEAYTGQWAPSFQAKTGTTATGVPLYGYYRLLTSLDFRTCVKYGYPSWLNVSPRYDCSQRGQDRYVNPYTYACNLNPALQAGIVGGAIFDPAGCNPQWSCTITGDILVNGISQDITLMRNGESQQVTNPTPTAQTDPNYVRSPRSWLYKNTVDEGSTPFFGTDPNSSKQYFKASWRWDGWQAYRNSDTIAFYWASDSPAKPFSWSQTYAFTADFYIPVQSSAGSGTSYQWVTSGAYCPQVKQSANINVVRSVSNPSDH